MPINRSTTLLLRGELDAYGSGPTHNLPANELRLLGGGVESAYRLDLISASCTKQWSALNPMTRSCYWFYDVADDTVLERIDLMFARLNSIQDLIDVLGTAITAYALPIIGCDHVMGRLRITTSVGAPTACGFAFFDTVPAGLTDSDGYPVVSSGQLHHILGARPSRVGIESGFVTEAGTAPVYGANAHHYGASMIRIDHPVDVFLRCSTTTNHVCSSNMELGNTSTDQCHNTNIFAKIDSAHPNAEMIEYKAQREGDYGVEIVGSDSQINSLRFAFTDRGGLPVNVYCLPHHAPIEYMICIKVCFLLNEPIFHNPESHKKPLDTTSVIPAKLPFR